MAPRARRPERREEPLTRQRIVEAAIDVLDTAGAGGLTFRVLAERLATGPGAIYWHVAGKDELLAAAAEAVLAEALAAGAAATTPDEAIRALALDVFDAIDAHPWIGTQLALAPTRAPMLGVFEHLGRQVQALGVSGSARFTAVSALLNYILGVGGQNAANARGVDPATDRTQFLGAVADTWARLDPDEYAFTRGMADQLREHDDREEFLAGIDLVLAGITTRLTTP
ncbi:TetR family transcriptional regulator [Streptomyces sp. SID5910]|uniref:TetR/AcrR family transcriptional regulator n=1 Tax=Streptomyces sp. SID5910 TaxID=2690312 RepID=UPI001371B925|nr:TetR family transcriptional regulator [Streptomyces sp. SID5910]MYR44923.1 TetR family transcriptional regulator [Streptomyces sp. SID5910]